MEVRGTLKKIVHFANWEYKEKRPKSVKVLRIKSKNLFSIGILPELQIRTIGPIVYVVVSDYGDTLMIYFFNRNGEREGGRNYESTPRFLKKLDKTTIVKYQLPKKERSDMLDDTLRIQREFNKIQQHISNILGIYYKYPNTILIKKELSFNANEKLGVERVRKELHIPLELINRNYLEYLATVEWFYSYLRSSITVQKISYIQDILRGLAMLLSAIFNIKFIDKIKNLKLISNKISIQDRQFYLKKYFELSLSSITHLKSKKKLLVLLKNYCNMLKLFNHYRISLSLLEVIQLFIISCEIFNVKTDIYAFYTEEKPEISYYFYFRIFSRAHEISKELKLEQLEFKTFLLSYLFGIHILKPEEINETPYTLTQVVENIGRLIKDPEIYEGIQRLDHFVSDMISEYILKYLKFNSIYELENQVLDFILEIENQSNYLFQDFEFELVWKPKNRIEQISKEKQVKSTDLHERLETVYHFLINSKGSVTLDCQISFTNPLFEDEIVRKKIKLQKIIVR